MRVLLFIPVGPVGVLPYMYGVGRAKNDQKDMQDAPIILSADVVTKIERALADLTTHACARKGGDLFGLPPHSPDRSLDHGLLCADHTIGIVTLTDSVKYS